MITEEEWLAFMDDLQQTLNKFGVPQPEQAKSRQLWRVHTKQSWWRRSGKAADATPSILKQALDRKGPDRPCVFITDLPGIVVRGHTLPSGQGR
jgi:hypothetical protein